MITCPKCGHENQDMAMNCHNCRINLKWAFENIETIQSSRLINPQPEPPISLAQLDSTPRSPGGMLAGEASTSANSILLEILVQQKEHTRLLRNISTAATIFSLLVLLSLILAFCSGLVGGF